MTDVKMDYLNKVKAKGRDYWYYRRHGERQRIDGRLGTPEFSKNYNRIHAAFEAQPTTGTGTAHGTLAWLMTHYLGSPEYGHLSPNTKKHYRHRLDRLRKEFGHLVCGNISRRFVIQYRDSMAATPGAANATIKLIRILFTYGIDREMVKINNPAARVKNLKLGDGWQPWPEAALARFHEQARGAVRLAFMLALYTGQRRGDVLAMRWSDITADGFIRVEQGKTGTKLEIPIHPTLAAELAKVEKRGLAIVGQPNGIPYSDGGFQYLWVRERTRLGLLGVVFHGLRKNAVQALFEADCTPMQVQAITGHASLEMVAHYGKGANQKRMAMQAMNKLTTISDKPGDKPAKWNGGRGQ